MYYSSLVYKVMSIPCLSLNCQFVLSLGIPRMFKKKKKKDCLKVISIWLKERRKTRFQVAENKIASEHYGQHSNKGVKSIQAFLLTIIFHSHIWDITLSAWLIFPFFFPHPQEVNVSVPMETTARKACTDELKSHGE